MPVGGTSRKWYDTIVVVEGRKALQPEHVVFIKEGGWEGNSQSARAKTRASLTGEHQEHTTRSTQLLMNTSAGTGCGASSRLFQLLTRLLPAHTAHTECRRYGEVEIKEKLRDSSAEVWCVQAKYSKQEDAEDALRTALPLPPFLSSPLCASSCVTEVWPTGLRGELTVGRGQEACTAYACRIRALTSVAMVTPRKSRASTRNSRVPTRNPRTSTPNSGVKTA